MTVYFFNTPYVLFDGMMRPKMIPDMLTATGHHVGHIYTKRYHMQFSIYIYDCLYEYNK